MIPRISFFDMIYLFLRPVGGFCYVICQVHGHECLCSFAQIYATNTQVMKMLNLIAVQTLVSPFLPLSCLKLNWTHLLLPMALEYTIKLNSKHVFLSWITWHLEIFAPTISRACAISWKHRLTGSSREHEKWIQFSSINLILIQPKSP